MKLERDLIRRVLAAKTNNDAADELISDYLPFIKAETAKFLQRPPIEGSDDELSIALMAFHEAILGYSEGRGAFIPYAAMLIKSRLIDYARSERRFYTDTSLEEQAYTDAKTTVADTIAGEDDHAERIALRDATAQEIAELTEQLNSFGVSLSDVADNCPKQQRTLEACAKVLIYAVQHKEVLKELLRTKKLPVAMLLQCGVERKTIERHRRYLIAILVIHTNGYEIIRDHIKNVLKGG